MPLTKGLPPHLTLAKKCPARYAAMLLPARAPLSLLLLLCSFCPLLYYHLMKAITVIRDFEIYGAVVLSLIERQRSASCCLRARFAASRHATMPMLPDAFSGRNNDRRVSATCHHSVSHWYLLFIGPTFEMRWQIYGLLGAWCHCHVVNICHHLFIADWILMLLEAISLPLMEVAVSPFVSISALSASPSAKGFI